MDDVKLGVCHLLITSCLLMGIAFVTYTVVFVLVKIFIIAAFFCSVNASNIMVNCHYRML